jgi:hypothetical protein
LNLVEPRSMRNHDLPSTFETVFSVTDYWDGPLTGIANYRGNPHYNERIFDETTDKYSEKFRLTPVDSQTLQLAMEAWEIWKRWEAAFQQRKTDLARHPRYSADSERYAEINRKVQKALARPEQDSITQIGKFEPVEDSNLPRGVMRVFQVSWTQP